MWLRVTQFATTEADGKVPRNVDGSPVTFCCVVREDLVSRLEEGRPINLSLPPESCAPSSAASDHDDEYFFTDHWVDYCHRRLWDPGELQLAVTAEGAAPTSGLDDAATSAAPANAVPPTPPQGDDLRAQRRRDAGPTRPRSDPWAGYQTGNASAGWNPQNQTSHRDNWHGWYRSSRSWARPRPSGRQRAEAAGIDVPGGIIWHDGIAPDLPNTNYRHVFRICGTAENELMQEKFRHVRERLKDRVPFHGRG